VFLSAFCLGLEFSILSQLVLTLSIETPYWAL
jgi:hypothetical protein